jgi:hypothetical protein
MPHNPTMPLEEAIARVERMLTPTFEEKLASFQESTRLTEHGTKGMKWGVHTHHDEPPKQVGGYGFKSKKAMEMFGKKYNELERPQKNQVKAELKRLGIAAPHLGAKYGLPPQPAGFKVKAALEMFGRPYKELSTQEKNQLKADLRNRGVIRPMGSGEAKEGEKELREAKVVSVKPLGGGINETKLVTLEGGIKAVFKEPSENDSMVRGNIKSGKGPEREVGAWEVAKLAGYEDIVPPTVFRTMDGKAGSLMKFWDGDLARKIAEKDDYMNKRPAAYDGDTDLHRTAMFDYVIGNEDRHMGNWLVGNGKLQLIDHGLSFPDREFSYGSRGNVKIMDEVARRERREGQAAMSVADAGKPFLENKDAILSALTKLGLSEESVKGVGSRIDRISRKDSWRGLFRK